MKGLKENSEFERKLWVWKKIPDFERKFKILKEKIWFWKKHQQVLFPHGTESADNLWQPWPCPGTNQKWKVFPPTLLLHHPQHNLYHHGDNQGHRDDPLPWSWPLHSFSPCPVPGMCPVPVPSVQYPVPVPNAQSQCPVPTTRYAPVPNAEYQICSK